MASWMFDELLALLRDECNDPHLAFCGQTWIPLGVGFSHPHHRSVRLLDCAPIGFGTFGVVFAVALSVPPVDNSRALRFVPAAMKVALYGPDFVSEVSNGLAMNELVASGATPGVTRLIDAFAVCGRKMQTSMPSKSWTRFWDGLRAYLDRELVSDTIRGYYGKVPDAPDALLDALRERGTLFFHFSELSLQVLAKKTTARAPARSESPSPPAMLHHRVGGDRTRGLLVDLWQRWQTLAAVHEAGALHGDLHRGNFISHRSGRARSSVCRLADAESRARADASFGRAGLDRPPDDFCDRPWRLYALPVHVEARREAGHEFACVALSPDDPAVTLIDFGCMFRGNAPRGASSENVRREWEPVTGKLPLYIVSPNPPRHDPNARYRSMGVPGTPGAGVLMGLVNRPTTALLTRPPEILNPPRVRAPLRVVYSELSDVFSLAASCVAEILGYEPLGDRLLANTIKNAGSLGIFADRTSPDSAGRTYFVLPHPLRKRARAARFVADPRYANRTPRGFERLVVGGDDWVQLDSTLPTALASALGRARDFQKLTRDWLGAERDLYRACHSMVARIYALGRPPDRLLENTLFEPHIREHFRRDADAAQGWLRPTLLRVLCAYYGVATPLATDFVDLVMDALSWDPADRPRASTFLECRVFGALYRELADFDLQRPLAQLWSAQTPTVNTWPVHADHPTQLLAPKDAPPFVQPLVPGAPVPWSVRAREACRAVSRLQHRSRSYMRFPGFLSKRAGRALKICPRQSQLFYYFAFVMGALDIYDATTLRTLNPDDDKGGAGTRRRRCVAMPGLVGCTRNSRNLRGHMSALAKQLDRLPDWLLVPRPPNSKRSREGGPEAAPPPKKPRV